MKPNPRPRRHLPRIVALTITLVASTLLTAPTAHAAPVFSESDLDGNSHAFEASPTDCAEAGAADPPITSLPVAENGATATAEHSGSATFTNIGDASDVIAVSTTISGRARVTSTGGNPGLLELDASGRVAADATKPDSACRANAHSYVDLDFTFTVTQPGFLTVTSKAGPFTFVDFNISDSTGDVQFGVYAGNSKPAGVHTIYLPAGVYSGEIEADAVIGTAKSVPSTPVSASLHARFDVAGSQTATPAGKAARYVALPDARSCATGYVDTTITSRGKRARKIQKVRFFVNGRAAGSVKRPAKGAVTKVPVADDAAASLRAVVTEVRRKNGKPGKVTEVSATYAPCS